MTVSIGLLGTGWPTFITAHAWIVWAGVALGIVLLIAGFVISTNQQSPQMAPSSNTAGRDNWGNQINAPGSTFNLSVPDASLPEAEKPATISPPEPTEQMLARELPTLSLDFGNGRVSYHGGRFEFDENGSRCITIRVLNRPAREPGSTSVRARSVIAHLTLSYSLTSTAIACAYWVGRHENRINLEPGKPEDLLVALIDHPLMLKLYDNPLPYPLETLAWDSPLSIAAHQDAEPKLFSWVDDMNVEGEVFLISKMVNQSTTLAYKKFKILKSGTESGLPSFRVWWVE